MHCSSPSPTLHPALACTIPHALHGPPPASTAHPACRCRCRRDVARRQLTALRTALRWDVVPVITEWDPRFNTDAPVLVERLFDPFNRRNKFQPSGLSYPAAGEERAAAK